MKTIGILAISQIIFATGAYFLIKTVVNPRTGAPATESSEKEKSKPARVGNGVWEIHLIENIIVNPAGTNGTRYLSTSVGLEVEKNPEATKIVEEKTPIIRDIMIAVLTSKTMEELSSSTGKESIRTEIQQKLEEVLAPYEIHRIYFVDYVLQ